MRPSLWNYNEKKESYSPYSDGVVCIDEIKGSRLKHLIVWILRLCLMFSFIYLRMYIRMADCYRPLAFSCVYSFLRKILKIGTCGCVYLYKVCDEILLSSVFPSVHVQHCKFGVEIKVVKTLELCLVWFGLIR